MVSTSHTNPFSFTALVVLRRVFAPAVAVVSLLVVMWLYGVQMREPYQALMIIVALLALILFPVGDQKDALSQRFWAISLSTFFRWCLLVAILLLLGYATKTSSVYSRKLLFSWLILTPPMLAVAHICIDILITRSLLSANNARRVVIAGASELGQRLAKKIRTSRRLGMKVEGFFDDRNTDRLTADAGGNQFSADGLAPVLGRLKDLPDYVQAHGVDLIYIVLPIRNIQRVSELLDQLQDTTASIYFVPDVFVFDLIQCRTDDIDGLPVVALCETPFQGTQGAVKRLSDYAIASIVLLLTSPLLLAIAAAIKLTSPGSVIFKQRRYGIDGREIVVYKFRSMTVSEDADTVRQATRGDERITRVGAFLRKYSLDELPQFINVLQGRMSVVGPRPHAVAHNEEYRPLIKGYMVRHKVNPGITGLAQVLGYRGETRTIDAMRKRVEYDLEYLRNWSLALDMRIIAKTVRIMLNDKMAF